MKGLQLTTETVPLLERMIIYNEKLEEIDFSNNKLSNLSEFFKNLNRNWLSQLSKLNFSNNQITFADLKAFLDIFDRDSRAFDRLLLVLRVLNFEGNPFTKTNPYIQK